MRLLTEVERAGMDVVLVRAPGGFGKTTFVAQWAARTGRPVAWATMTPSDADAVVLISTIMAALVASGVDSAEPLGHMTADEPAFSRRVLPGFQRALEGTLHPITVVLDDVHAIPGSQAGVVFSALVQSLPTGSQLALVGRSRPDVPAELWLSQGRLMEVGPDRLAFDDAEVAQFVSSLPGAEIAGATAEAIAASTAGWPVAVYLQALAAARDGDLQRIKASPELADYLDAVVLRHAEGPLRTFLRRTSILPALSASACNAVLDSDDSPSLLLEASRETLLITRMDGTDDTYRLHPLLRERLERELTSTEPELALELHARAARWCDSRGFVEEAIAQAARSGDMTLLGDIVWRHSPPALIASRHTAVDNWLALVDEDTIAAVPSLAMTATWLSVLKADGTNALRWATAAARGLGPDWRLTDQPTSVHAALALLEAYPGVPSFEAAAASAGVAFDWFPVTHPLRPLARFIQGVNLACADQLVSSRGIIDEARELSRSSGYGTTIVGTSAMLAVLEIQAGNWTAAEDAITLARRAWAEYDLEEGNGTAWVFAPSAFMHARSDATAAALADIQRVDDMITGMSAVIPVARVLAAAFVGRAYSALDDDPAASSSARVAREVLDQLPPSRFLASLVTSADHELQRSQVLARLSPAERRLWPHLMGRGTLKEIAGEVHVSPETVKSQLASIYRKLGVSSRRQLQDLTDRRSRL